jgi:hypothetical protein
VFSGCDPQDVLKHVLRHIAPWCVRSARPRRVHTCATNNACYPQRGTRRLSEKSAAPKVLDLLWGVSDLDPPLFLYALRDTISSSCMHLETQFLELVPLCTLSVFRNCIANLERVCFCPLSLGRNPQGFRNHPALSTACRSIPRAVQCISACCGLSRGDHAASLRC